MAIGIEQKLRIAKVSGNNCFEPKGCISRQDMMVLTARIPEKYRGLKMASYPFIYVNGSL